MEKLSKIYIAGHRGMVGSSILRALQAKGYSNFLLKTSAELDLRNQQAVANFFSLEKPDYVFLAAAKVGGIVANNTYRADFIYENMMIQSNVIHQAYLNGVKKLLFLGSSCIYPKLAPQPLKEEYLLTGFLEPTNAQNKEYCLENNLIAFDMPNEGRWSIDIVSGLIRFVPQITFFGNPTSVTYFIRDFNENISNEATISFDLLPVTQSDLSNYVIGQPVTMNLIQNDTIGDAVNPTTIEFTNPTTPNTTVNVNGASIIMQVSGEGIWNLSTVNGEVSFTPEATFTGTPSIQSYRVQDFQGNWSNVSEIQLSYNCVVDVVCPVFLDEIVSCASEIPLISTLFNIAK